jgi:hypothetical protein
MITVDQSRGIVENSKNQGRLGNLSHIGLSWELGATGSTLKGNLWSDDPGKVSISLMANMIAKAFGVEYMAEYSDVIVTETMSTHLLALAR